MLWNLLETFGAVNGGFVFFFAPCCVELRHVSFASKRSLERPLQQVQFAVPGGGHVGSRYKTR